MKFNTAASIHRGLNAEDAVRLAMMEALQRHTHTDGSPVEFAPVKKEYEGLEKLAEETKVKTTDQGFNVKYKTESLEVGFHCKHCDQFLFMQFFDDGSAEMDVKNSSYSNQQYSNQEYGKSDEYKSY
jgi:hypothetical protein